MATMTFGLSGSIVNSNKTYASGDPDVTSLLQWGSVAYQQLLLSSTASFTAIAASISSATMTVTQVFSGSLATNQFVFGPNILQGTYITAGPGGGPGTYTVNYPQTVAASSAIRSYGPDVVASNCLYQGTMNAWIQAQQKYA